MPKKPYLSICIPTYDRIEILVNTIESIYSDLRGVSMDEFEVIISDNESNQSAKNVIDGFIHENLLYFSTDCEGFLNSFNSLQCGNGQFLKLHNNYTKLRKGTLKKMIDAVKDNCNEKPVIFYTNGLKQTGKIEQFDSYNSFMYKLSYFSSWSTGFSIWKDDFHNASKKIEIDKFFPQTSLLLSQANKSCYIINDKTIFDNQKIPNKGGYNIFKVFSINYVSLIEKCFLKNEISIQTFRKIKSDLLYDYLSVRYFKTVILKIDNFEKSNIKKSVNTYYSNLSYYLMIMIAFIAPIKISLRKIKIIFFRLNK